MDRLTMLERSVCSRPFTHLQINSGGVSFTCRPRWMNKSIGVAPNGSLDDLWNSAEAQEIRSSVLDGSFKYCNRSTCIYLESGRGQVGTLSQLKARGVPTRVLRDIQKHRTKLDYGPRNLTLSYDRSCNLACPMCRPSALVHQDAEKEEVLKVQRWVTDHSLTDAREVYVSNTGDALASPYFRQFLRKLNQGQAPKLERITLGTNGTVWSRRVWNSLSRYSRSRIKDTYISIDATQPETYHRLRVGANWSRLMENLSFVSELRRSAHLQRVTLAFVVQSENFRQMKDFLKLRDRFQFDRVQFSPILQAWGQERSTHRDRFRSSAVHFPEHPEHEAFTHGLKELSFDGDPSVVFVGDFAELAKNDFGVKCNNVAYDLRTLDSQLKHLESRFVELRIRNAVIHRGLTKAIKNLQQDLDARNDQLSEQGQDFFMRVRDLPNCAPTTASPGYWRSRVKQFDALVASIKNESLPKIQSAHLPGYKQYTSVLQERLRQIKALMTRADIISVIERPLHVNGLRHLSHLWHKTEAAKSRARPRKLTQ